MTTHSRNAKGTGQMMMTWHVEMEVKGDEAYQIKGQVDLDRMAQQV